MPERLVVIGGDAAGMSAASQARRRRPPDDLDVIAFEKGHYTSYSACGIPYAVGGVVEDFETLVTRTPERFRTEFAIDARTQHEVREIDLDRGRVTAWDAVARRDVTEGFDHLVVATGAVPVRPDIPGVDGAGIYGVQTLDDGRAILDDLAATDARCGVVIGGGYIGLEMAEALKQRDMEVALVEAAPQPMSTLDPDMASLVADAMRAMGIALYTNEAVESFNLKEGRVAEVVTERRTLPADIVILGLGVRPNIDLARDAGIQIGRADGIEVNRRMQTSVDGVWAAGDCAEKFHRVSRRAVSIPLGTHANKEGRVIGINIGGGYATFPGVVGTAVSKVCDTEVARTGLKEEEARSLGFETVTASIESTTRAGYYPGAVQIHTKLIVERRSGRLLGAQIVGKEGAAKRIDVVAAALWNEMTVDEMLNLDLSYAPPYSPVWDPVLIAARKAWQRVEETVAGSE